MLIMCVPYFSISGNTADTDTAAVALGKLTGVEVEVFDQARELREIGASIALQPCALRCLEKLGLGEEVERLAYRHGEHPLVRAFSTRIEALGGSPWTPRGCR
jgi:2-polyprenyl-6-methoxyphenol hydroxylase-like FAD-dependent oxidoreductase